MRIVYLFKKILFTVLLNMLWDVSRKVSRINVYTQCFARAISGSGFSINSAQMKRNLMSFNPFLLDEFFLFISIFDVYFHTHIQCAQNLIVNYSYIFTNRLKLKLLIMFKKSNNNHPNWSVDFLVRKKIVLNL